MIKTALSRKDTKRLLRPAAYGLASGLTATGALTAASLLSQYKGVGPHIPASAFKIIPPVLAALGVYAGAKSLQKKAQINALVDELQSIEAHTFSS